MHKVDLNCDMGEGFGVYKMENDQELLKYISSANIACGFHAGDPSTMRQTVSMALKQNVGIGAHPGFQDLVGFGRRNIAITPQEVYDLTLYQIGALNAFVQSEGGNLQHVKPHGALYNMAANNTQLATAIAEAIYKVNPELILFGLAGSELIHAGEKLGLHTASEVFSDRTYQPNGTLTPRDNTNALITDHERAIKQVIRIVKEGLVTSLDGQEISITAQTICIHGDGAHALHYAKEISQALKQAGIAVAKINELI